MYKKSLHYHYNCSTKLFQSKKVFFLIFNKCDPSIMKQRVSLKDVQVVSENTGRPLEFSLE